MKFLFSFLIIMSPLFASASFFSADLAAKATADFWNNAKTFEGAVDSLTAGATQVEAQGVREIFAKMKIKMDTTLPKAVAMGPKVTFEKSSDVIVFKSDRTFTLNSRVFRPYLEGGIDQYLKNSLDKMNGKETSLINLFLPQAFAWKNGFATHGLMALVAGAAVTVGSVTIYSGKEIAANMKNNSVVCDGPYFKLSSKSRNAMLLASSKENILDPEKVNQVFGETVTCDQEKAAQLQRMIKAAPETGKQLKPDPTSPSGGTR